MKSSPTRIALGKRLDSENPEVEQQLDAVLEADALLTEMGQVGHQVRDLARRQSVPVQRSSSLHATVCLPPLQVAPLDTQLVDLNLQLRRPIVIVQVLLQTAQQGLNLVQSGCGLGLGQWPSWQVIKEVLAVVLVAELGDQVAQTAFP